MRSIVHQTAAVPILDFFAFFGTMIVLHNGSLLQQSYYPISIQWSQRLLLDQARLCNQNLGNNNLFWEKQKSSSVNQHPSEGVGWGLGKELQRTDHSWLWQWTPAINTTEQSPAGELAGNWASKGVLTSDSSSLKLGWLEFGLIPICWSLEFTA